MLGYLLCRPNLPQKKKKCNFYSFLAKHASIYINLEYGLIANRFFRKKIFPIKNVSEKDDFLVKFKKFK
jgi:hypothetical protein